MVGRDEYGPERAAAMQALFEGFPEAAVVLQLTEDGDDLLVVAANPALARELGRPTHELVGRPGSSLYPPQAFLDVLEKARAALDGGSPVTYEAMRELPSGRRTVAGTMLPVGDRLVVAFGRDVSEEREAVGQLERLERTAQIGSWQWNIADGSLTWSEEYRRILGVDDRLEPSEAYLMSVMHPDDQARVRAGMDRVADGGPPSAGVRFRIRRPDGQLRTVEGKGDVVRGPDGRVLRMSGIVQDVTEQVENEQRERQIAEVESRQRQAMELNDDIVQGLAAARLALQLGRSEQAREIVVRTADAAQALVASLLRRDPNGRFRPGGLVRAATPASEAGDT